ncbi:hypothetical protein EDD21DRAFT_405960 [Dissophora ornata]|nr:hypothetical protein BGZ58_001685 [Dissophora ornata]KAI8599521.1 hypothetical protein EDD21DRAFT_405960 [Dissophora ornata]
MSHQRSKSTSDLRSSNPPHPPPVEHAETAPLSISIPRRGSMSTSFGLAASPITFGSAKFSAPTTNPFLNPIVSPSSNNGPHSASAFGTTPPTNLSGLSSSIPPSFNRRFSTGFTNPLNNHPLAGSANASTASTQTKFFVLVVMSQQQAEDRAFRSTVFAASSPPLSRYPTNKGDLQSPEFGGGGGGGGGAGSGGGGIGGLLRKFSRSGSHPLDSNEPGPAPVTAQYHYGFGNNDSRGAARPSDGHNSHLSAVEALKQPQPQEKISRPGTPMRNMILTGQMLD